MGHKPMPLLNTMYESGKINIALEGFEDPSEKGIARAEYYYFSGKPEQAAEMAESYLYSKDEMFQFSAFLIYAFANISLGNIQKSRYAIGKLKEMISQKIQHAKTLEEASVGVFFATAASVLLHLPYPNVPPLMECIRYLPEGLKVYGGYILAHQAYLQQDYGKSIGIAETTLLFYKEKYPIATIYLRLIMSASLMGSKRTEEAKEHFMSAWELAKEDGLMEPFGEHHGLLYGLIENCLKKDYNKEYERIIGITYSFSAGWRRIHNPIVDGKVADNLTTTEFAVSMLANRGWTNTEIAQHMNLSVHTVKKYISDVYQKLGISSRKELHQFMLQ